MSDAMRGNNSLIDFITAYNALVKRPLSPPEFILFMDKQGFEIVRKQSTQTAPAEAGAGMTDEAVATLRTLLKLAAIDTPAGSRAAKHISNALALLPAKRQEVE